MTFTLTFSHIQEGRHIPYIENGVEVTRVIEADSKSAAIMHPDIVQFCEDKGVTVRRVT